MNDILNLLEPIQEDNSLTRYEFHNLLPYSSTNLDNNDEIRIPLHQQDVLTLPAESRIHLQGTLQKGAVAPYEANDGLCNNAMAHLFSEIRYELNGIVIERVRNPGLSTLLKGLTSFSYHDIVRQSNTSFNIQYTTQSEFSFTIPLKNFLGFAEDYKKILLNVKHELILIRSRTNTNALRDTVGNKEITLILKSIQWQVPFINVNDSYRLQLMELLKKNIPIQIPFRSRELYEYPNLPSATSTITWPIRMSSNQEKPRFVIIGFQTNRNEVLKADSSVFDHCNVRDIRLFIGSETYPYTPMEANFETKQVATLYENFTNFRKQYYFGFDMDSGNAAISLKDFIASYPIWVIDCSRQSEVIKSGAVDIRLEIDARENFPAHTNAYTLIISERLIEYIPFSGIVRHLY